MSGELFRRHKRKQVQRRASCRLASGWLFSFSAQGELSDHLASWQLARPHLIPRQLNRTGYLAFLFVLDDALELAAPGRTVELGAAA
jgi:hypothetical protein